jgi:hypothetical protein
MSSSKDKLIDRTKQRIVALLYYLQAELVFRVVFILPAGPVEMQTLLYPLQAGIACFALVTYT